MYCTDAGVKGAKSIPLKILPCRIWSVLIARASRVTLHFQIGKFILEGFCRTSNLHFRPPYQPHRSTYNGTFVSLYAYLWYDHNCLIGIARNNHALDHLLLRKLKAVILKLFDKNLDSFGMTYESWVYALDFESRPCLEWLLQRFIQVRWSPLI